MSTTIVYRYEVDPIWKADVERLLSEAKAAPGEHVPAERLGAYLVANRDKAIRRTSDRSQRSPAPGH